MLIFSFGYGAFTLSRGPSQILRLDTFNALMAALQPHAYCYAWFGLFPVRSPLLGESQLISTPAGT